MERASLIIILPTISTDWSEDKDFVMIVEHVKFINLTIKMQNKIVIFIFIAAISTDIIFLVWKLWAAQKWCWTGRRAYKIFADYK